MVRQTTLESTAPIFIKPDSVQPKTLNGDVKMPETKDDDEVEDIERMLTQSLPQSLPTIREEAKIVLERFLKRSLSQNDASPMRQVAPSTQLEVITEGTALSENGTHQISSHGAKPKKKFAQSKNGGLKVRPSFDRSDSYTAAAKQSVLDEIVGRRGQKTDDTWKTKSRNKANTVSSADYKDNVKRSNGAAKPPRRASSQKVEGLTPKSPGDMMGADTLASLSGDRKDSFSSRHDSSSDEDEDSLKKRKKKNVFKRAKERLRMSFRKREVNARERYLKKQSKEASPKHHPITEGSAPVINITKATPSPDKSSSGSAPNSSPSTGDILEELAVVTPSSRGSADKSGSNVSNGTGSHHGNRDIYADGSNTPTTPSPSSSKKFKVKTGSDSPGTSGRYSVSPVPRADDDSKPSLWKWFKTSKLSLKRRSSKDKASTPTKAKSAEALSPFAVSDTRINQIQVSGSADIKRTSSLGRYEGMRIQQNLSPEKRTSSVGACDSKKYTLTHSGDVIVSHGPSGDGMDKEPPKRRESLREELKRTFSIGKGDNLGIQKKHSFKGRCSYADRDNLTLDLVPALPRGQGPSVSRVQGGGGLPSAVVVDCVSDDEPVTTPSQKPLSERTEAEREEIYNKIAEKLASISEEYTSPPFTQRVTSPPRQPTTISVDHAITPPGAAGGQEEGPIEKTVAEYLRKKGDDINKAVDLVDGTSIPQEAVMDIVRTMSYRKFKKVMQQYSENSEPNFHQLSQLFYLARGAVQLVGVGGTAVHNIKEFTLNYFTDYFAGWIVGKGGWDSVIETDSDSDDVGTQV